MARYPAAKWRPITRYAPGGSAHRPTFTGRRGIAHTAVSNATPSMFSYFNVEGRATPHFYFGEHGECEQYIDTEFGSSAVLDGAPTCITFESWDGYGETWEPGDPVPPWTPEQVEAIARWVVWCYQEHGIPIVPLPSSLPGTQGFGWHRQGIDGNFPKTGIFAGRVPGGEHWSKSTGKPCPGDARIRQYVDVVIPRALELADPGVTFSALCANFDFVNERWQDFEDGHLIERVRPRVVLGCELKDRRLKKLLPSYDVHQAPGTDLARANSAVAWDPEHVRLVNEGYELLVEPNGQQMQTRHIAWADLEIDGVIQKFGAMHMPKKEFQDALWRPSLRALEAFIEASPYDVVLGGDWNRLVTGGRVGLDCDFYGHGFDGFAVPEGYKMLRLRALTDTESDHDFTYARFRTTGGTR